MMMRKAPVYPFIVKTSPNNINDVKWPKRGSVAYIKDAL